MKRFFVIVIMSIMSAVGVMAFNRGDSRLGVQLVGSYNSTMGYPDFIHGRPGIGAGFAYHLEFNKLVFIEPSLNMWYTRLHIDGNIGNDNRYHYEGPFDMFTVGLGVDVGFNVVRVSGVKVMVLTGPRLCNLIKAHYNLTENYLRYEDYYGSQDVPVTGQPVFPGLDFDWCVGIGADYKRFYARARAGFGLNIMAKFILEDNIAVRRQFGELALGFYL